MSSNTGTFTIEDEDIVRLQPTGPGTTRSGWVNVGAFALWIQLNEKGDLELDVHPALNEIAALASICVSKASAMQEGATDLDMEVGYA